VKKAVLKKRRMVAGLRVFEASARAGHAAQSQTTEVEVALQMREAHLNLTALPRGLPKRFRSRKAGDMLAHIFMTADGE
jgi:hypothetical protein